MDLSDFEIVRDGKTFLQLRHPVTDVPLADDNGPVGVRLYGKDSEQYQAVKLEFLRESVKGSTKGKAPVVDETLVERADQKAVQTMAACIFELVNVSCDGELMEAPKDSMAFLTKFPWAIDQIDPVVNDRSRFTKASLKTS